MSKKAHVCTISEIIENLEEIKEEHGDLPVYYADEMMDGPESPGLITLSIYPGGDTYRSKKITKVWIDIGDIDNHAG